ncbi:MAG: hypothetical protein AB7O26_20620, partial [Planctomycetaceae bacterium]
GRDPVSPMATYRCRYQIRSSERQRLRIDLPSEAQPLGVAVDGRQIALEKSDAKADVGWTPYFVSVARTAVSDVPFTIALNLQRPISPAPFQSNGGNLQIALPRIGGTEGVATQQLRVVLWVPDKFALIGTPANYQRETRTLVSGVGLGTIKTESQTGELDSWIGSTGGLIDFPTEGHAYQYTRLGRADSIEVKWWNMPFLTVVISLAVLGIALALLKTTWENRLGLLLIAALLIALYAVKDNDAALHLVAAARYGLWALAGIWLIHALLGSRGTSSAVSPSGSGPATQAAVIPPSGPIDAPLPDGPKSEHHDG